MPLFNHKRFLLYPELSDNENRIYRNFNFVLLFSLVDILIIAAVVQNVLPRWPFYFALLQFLILSFMLYLHLHGWLKTARVVSFIVTILVQVLASLTHGSLAGFDYVLFAICVLPLLFFESRKFYLPLFLLGMSAHLFVKFEYTFFPPLVSIDSDFPTYWNVFFTSSLIFIALYIFKRSYQQSQESLQKQNEDISKQKEEITSINDSLEQLVNQRDKKVKEHEALLEDFANINAHKVRSPLARIIGLAHLAELEDNKTRVIDDFIPLIHKNAQELNDILIVVGQKLNSLQDESRPESRK